MSLVGTLAKVAIGVAIAKGVTALAQKGAANPGSGSVFGGAAVPASGTDLGSVLGGMLGGGQGAQSQGQQTTGQASGGLGGLGGLLDQLAGGAQNSQAQSVGASTGGLGDLLGSLAGAATGGRSTSQAGQAGGLGDLLGGLLGAAGGAGAAGGLGGLLGALTGGAGRTPSNDQSLGSVLNSSFNNQGEPDVEPTPHQNAAAAVMLAAMIQAAKSDGKIQQEEKDKLLSNLKDASAEEMAFVQAQLAAPVSIPTLVAHVPNGLQSQVYTMSVMAIDLDSQAEAQYLNDLAKAMGLDPQSVNQIHAQLGVPALYA